MGEKALIAINIDLPDWIVKELDDEAENLGINRKAVINVLLATVLEQRKRRRSTSDKGYLRTIEQSFAEEWASDEDDEAFRDL